MTKNTFLCASRRVATVTLATGHVVKIRELSISDLADIQAAPDDSVGGAMLLQRSVLCDQSGDLMFGTDELDSIRASVTPGVLTTIYEAAEDLNGWKKKAPPATDPTTSATPLPPTPKSDSCIDSAKPLDDGTAPTTPANV
jgi:hypothetical protein